MHNLEELQELLTSKPLQIVIFPHQRPDADALGSCLGLAAIFQKQGHQVNVISATKFPKFLNWMPNSEKVVIFPDDKQKSRELLAQADLLCCLDFSAPSRMAPLDKEIENLDAKILMIDHHLGKVDFADYELWDTEAAAAAELVYDFICMIGAKELIDIPVAQCLYAGIMTDTGSFKYPSTSSKVHLIAAELKKLGLNSSRIHNLIYDSNTEDRLRFLGHALLHNLKVFPEYRTAYFVISQEDIKRFNFQQGDSEGLVNYALSIEGICFAATMIDYKKEIRISLRSTGDFPVNDVASKYFHGGGHKNASGGRVTIPLNETEEIFTNFLPEYKEQLLNN
jgi:phosphoesterase RecJ-like protein